MAAKKKFDPTVGGWKLNRTGKVPVPADAMIEFRRRDGGIGAKALAGECRWDKSNRPTDIIWWRKARKPRADKGTKVAQPEPFIGVVITEDGERPATAVDALLETMRRTPLPEVEPAPVPGNVERRAALLEKYGKGWYDRVWIVGRFYAETWDFQGVFWKEPEAVSACVDDTWFVAPAQIGVALPVEPQPWPGLYYPVPAVEERQPAAEAATDHRSYRWGLVAVCVVVLVAIAFWLAGCAP